MPEKLKECTRCIYDESIPGISFNDKGECNYCDLHEDLKIQFKTGTSEGEKDYENILAKIKHDGKRKKYDCVVGVSGGTDSSYMLAMAIKSGLKPLAVHYDNTWNTAIATENIRKITTKLGVDLYTHVVDNKEADDIFKSFFEASVPELDGSTDIALAEVLYRAASKYKVKYILEGHSFMTEGVSPLGIMYVDGRYIKSIHKKFGSIKMKTFPNMNFTSFMKWILVKRIKKIRPLWYLDYSKEEARDYLMKEFNWEYYGGHHLENRMTAFHHSYYFPKKLKRDMRNNTLSACVRSGIIPREEAVKQFNEPPFLEPELLDYFKKRLQLSESEFDRIMKKPMKSYRDFKTYKRLFERLRPMFFVLAKANLVPMSFYVKYTSKTEM
jgi:N-acetyl sugar amidotransferase